MLMIDCGTNTPQRKHIPLAITFTAPACALWLRTELPTKNPMLVLTMVNASELRQYSRIRPEESRLLP